jgi:hypothetical protein
MEQELVNAAWNGNEEKARKILRENGEINVNWKDSLGRAPLHLACNYGHYKIVAMLLAHPDIDVNLKTNGLTSPFLFACSNGWIECAQLLLKDVRVKVNEYESTGHHPLMHAAYYGRLEIIKWWIASGREMDLGEPGNEHNDAIGAAGDRGYKKVVSLLELFRDYPNETRYEMRVKLGWRQEMAAEFFATVVFLCDGLLGINEKNTSGAAKFFGIAQRLPMELQIILCHRVAGSMRTNILKEHSELAFKKLAKELCWF